ncbi:MAG TPA: hypothetical protein VF209_02100 [Patescibacteria group bacterium]
MQGVKAHGLRFLTVGLFFSFLLWGVRSHSQSWYFQDETEHVTVGWMISAFDRQLYSTLSTNHQPLPVLVGALLAETIPHDTLFQFIDRLRISMWFLAFFASLFLTWRFKWRGVVATILTYSLGHYFLAWHVLAESLAVPAVLWLLLFLADNWWPLDAPPSQVRQSLDAVLTGLAIWWLGFTLLPLWPFAALSLVLSWQLFTTQERRLLLGSIFLPSLFLTWWFNPFYWWQETIVNNVLYFIPYETGHDPWHYLRLVAYPFFHIFSLNSPIARFYLAMVVLLLTLLVVKRPIIKWSRKNIFKVIGLFILVLCLNPRISQPNVTFYQGFHLFTYVAGVSVVISLGTEAIFSHFSSSRKNKMIAYSLGGLMVLLLINNLSWLSRPPDKLSEYYINYDTFQAYGNALKTISQPGNTLMTGPDGAGYMNMMAQLPLAGRQNFHLSWAYRTPYLRQAWLAMIKEHPPTFIYFNLGSDEYSAVLRPLLKTEYVALQRADGSPTLLHIRRDAMNDVSPSQWQALEAQAFRKPSLD